MYKRVLERLNRFQYGVLTQDICLEVESMLTCKKTISRFQY